MLLGCGSGLAPTAVALDRTQLGIAQLQGAGWQAQQVQVDVRVNTRPLQAQIRIGRATLDSLQEPLRNLWIDCRSVQLEPEYFNCPMARISGVFPYIGRQQFSGSMRYMRRTGAITLTLDGLKLAKGAAKLQAALRDSHWQGVLELTTADLAALLKLAEAAGKTLGVSGNGKVDARIGAQGQAAQVRHVDWQVKAQQTTINNAAGTLATDSLTVETTGQAHAGPQGWQIRAQLNAPSGQAYAEPVFVDLSKHPLTLNAAGVWDGARGVQLQQLHIEQQQVLSGSAHGQLQLDAANPAPALQVQIDQLQFPGSFATYLQPFLLDSSFKNLNTNGSLVGTLQVQDSTPVRVDMQLHNLHADDGSSNLRFEQVNGDIHWRKQLDEDAPPPRSTLSWHSGSLLGLELGATQLQLDLWDTNVRITEPTRIPIFNGALALEGFRVRKLGTPQLAFMLDATIEPINVAQLSKAFGWPEFGGELSGKITKLRMEEGVLTLGATLNAQVFDGTASIGDMRLEGALTQWPRFTANIAFQQLDLEQVTQAFSFGRITGRLSGEISDLELFNWQPVSFDARLYTPAKDRSKHRISQRAIQNIGSIGGSGGGVAAALQSGFLKFFEDFNYDKLGLNCRLTNDVCFMNGVGPAKDGGYYLVKGKGVPRIDVIGNATRVDWPRLVAQLKAITESSGPVVK